MPRLTLGGQVGQSTSRAQGRKRALRLVSAWSGRALEDEEIYTAGYDKADAGDVRREIGAEERDSVRDLLRLPDAAHRGAPDHALVHLGVAHVERLCADDPGDDRVAGDAVPASLERERAREAEDARLRRRVGRLAEAAERARNRGHVHDAAPAALLHVRPDRLCAVEAPGEVDAQVALPQLRALIRELCDVVERAGVVHEDVDSAELLDAARDSRVDLRAVGDVALQRERAPAERADLVDGRLGVDHPLRARRPGEHAVALGLLARVRLELDVGDRDVGSGTGERLRVGAPEPARPAGDERDAAGEVDLERHRPNPKRLDLQLVAAETRL